MRSFVVVVTSCVIGVHCTLDDVALLQTKTNSYLQGQVGEECKSGKCAPATTTPEVTEKPTTAKLTTEKPASCMMFKCKDTHHLKKKGKKMCGGKKCSHRECCRLNPTKPTTEKPTTEKPASCRTFKCKDTHHLKKKGKKMCGGKKCKHRECCRLNPTKPEEPCCADYECPVGWDQASVYPCKGGICSDDECCAEPKSPQPPTTMPEEPLCADLADYKCPDSMYRLPKYHDARYPPHCKGGICTDGECCGERKYCADYECPVEDGWEAYPPTLECRWGDCSINSCCVMYCGDYDECPVGDGWVTNPTSRCYDGVRSRANCCRYVDPGGTYRG